MLEIVYAIVVFTSLGYLNNYFSTVGRRQFQCAAKMSQSAKIRSFLPEYSTSWTNKIVLDDHNGRITGYFFRFDAMIS